MMHLNDNQPDNEVVVEDQKLAYNSFVVFFVIIWVILGLMGLLFSVVCFAYEGSFMQNWVGFLTAIVLGPFYWIYFAFADPTYCSTSKGDDSSQQQEITIISTPSRRKKIVRVEKGNTIPFASSPKKVKKATLKK